MVSLDELAARARQLVDRGITPACQYAVARDSEVVAFETFGDATPRSRFPVFSATKPLVASVIWQLIGEGALAPEQRVVEHVPEFGTNGKAVVTVEQVLLHTSGFPNASLEAVPGADPVERRAAFARWELEWEPGTRFEYHAGSAHWVLADLIERATGLDFRDAIEQRLTAPLGLPRVLGISPEEQGDVVDCVRIGARVDVDGSRDMVATFKDPRVRAAGVPGGGAIMTARTMALVYQAFLHNPGKLWDPDLLHDATANVRCTFEDPLMHVPANRSRGFVLAGDDGMHQLRYAMFGRGCSPGAFGHAGAYLQVAWADPATGISFAFAKNGCNDDMMRDAGRVLRLADLAAEL